MSFAPRLRSQMYGLKRHVLLERQRRAGGESIPVPAAVAPLVKRFVIGERFPDVAIDREGMGDPDSVAIAVDFICRPEPPDIHVAVGDFESADRELDCPVDAKLVLLERVGEPRRKANALVETAWRDLVIEVTGSNRQELRGPNRQVNLCDWYVDVTVVKAVGAQSDSLSYRSDYPEKAPGHEERAPSIDCSGRSRCLQFLGRTPRGKRYEPDRQNTCPRCRATLANPCIQLHERRLEGDVISI